MDTKPIEQTFKKALADEMAYKFIPGDGRPPFYMLQAVGPFAERPGALEIVAFNLYANSAPGLPDRKPRFLCNWTLPASALARRLGVLAGLAADWIEAGRAARA